MDLWILAYLDFAKAFDKVPDLRLVRNRVTVKLTRLDQG